MQRFQQIVYYNDTHPENNFPANIVASDLTEGRMFEGRTFSQLGIQAPPGTKFYVNNGANPVIVGYTGLFQIDLTTGCSITNLHFAPDSLQFINDNDNLYLIVDMAFEGRA